MTLLEMPHSFVLRRCKREILISDERSQQKHWLYTNTTTHGGILLKHEPVTDATDVQCSITMKYTFSVCAKHISTCLAMQLRI